VELYALNLTNVIKSTFTSDAQFSLQRTSRDRAYWGPESGTNSDSPAPRKTGDAHRSLVYG